MKRTFDYILRRILPNYLVAAGCCVYLFALGWLNGRHRGLFYLIADHFGRLREYPPRSLPVTTLDELPWGPVPIELLEPGLVDGNVTLLELLVLVRAVKAVAPQTILEIGTFDGRTTLNLAANAPSSCKVWTLDLPESALSDTTLQVLEGEKAFVRKAASGTRFLHSPLKDRIQQLLGDSASFDFAPYVGSVDLLFIDGSHAHDYVLNDSQVALRVRRGGKSLIFWHDYGTWPDVTEALNTLQRTDPAFRQLRQIQGTSLVYLAS